MPHPAPRRGGATGETTPMRLMAVGDLHLGRNPSRLPDFLSGRAGDLGPAGAWRRIVEAAVADEVHAVLLAGDVVEGATDFFEAYRELAAGIRRLSEAGIRVLGVAGNHDVHVLPRLADQVAGFELLGRGGKWESVTLEADGSRATVHGWSFEADAVRTSPLAGPRLERGPGLNFGLLHCDLDVTGSRYAPVRSRELEGAGLDGWLLGHIHVPGPLTAERPSGYLGAATGLDPGEPGPRGPWRIGIGGGAITSFEHLPLAPLHWDALPVDLTGIAEPEDARSRLLEALEALDRDLSARAHPPEAAGLRVRLTGRTDLRSGVEALLDAEATDDLHVGNGRIAYFVETFRYGLAPEIDLATMAERTDPPGLLARRLRCLARPEDDPERRDLIENARRELAQVAADPVWRPLGDLTLTDEEVAARLTEAGLALLDGLRTQDRERE